MAITTSCGRSPAPSTRPGCSFALAVEARRGLVEDEDARVRQQRAGDGTRWRCPLTAARLAPHHRVVLLRESWTNSSQCAIRLTPGCRRGRLRLRIRDVLGHGSVEQEVVLQHDAEVAAVVPQPHISRSRRRPARAPTSAVERHDERDERALAGPARPTSAVVVPAGVERDALQHRYAGLYSNATSSNRTSPSSSGNEARDASSWSRRHLLQLADAVEPAKASEICVRSTRSGPPRDGHGREEQYMMKSPSVIAPDRIDRPPRRSSHRRRDDDGGPAVLRKCP